MNTRILTATLLLATGCPQIEELEDTSNNQVPAAVQAAFDRTCDSDNSSCHSAAPTSGLISLDAASSGDAVQGMSSTGIPYVTIGDTDQSYMAHKLLPDPPMPITGVRMPQNFDENNAEMVEDTALIVGWIAGSEFPGGEGTGGTTTDATATDDTMGQPIQLCGIEDVKAGAPNPIVSGTGAMQIPPDIGEILANNCGCHYADELDITPAGGDYIGMLRISTWAEWQSEYELFMMPTRDVVLSRIGAAAIVPMPSPLACNIGGGVAWTDADQMTLEAWINAGTPDGANWMPAGGESGSSSDSGSSSGTGSTG